MANTRQKLVVANILNKVRKGQKISVSAEMRAVGYSESVSKQPHRITKSKAWES